MPAVPPPSQRVSIYANRKACSLRVEGRTPDDDEAVYRLRFGGAFEAITSGPLVEHEDALEATTAAAASNKGERRVSSVVRGSMNLRQRWLRLPKRRLVQLRLNQNPDQLLRNLRPETRVHAEQSLAERGRLERRSQSPLRRQSPLRLSRRVRAQRRQLAKAPRLRAPMLQRARPEGVEAHELRSHRHLRKSMTADRG